MMFFKGRIIKVMMGSSKSKKFNLKEKAIFRDCSREENMPRSKEKDELKKGERKSLLECSNFYHIEGRYATKKEEMEELTNKYSDQKSTDAHSERYIGTVGLSPLKLQSKKRVLKNSFKKTQTKPNPKPNKIPTAWQFI